MSIAVVGSSNTDMIVKVPHLPNPGETVLGGEFIKAAGGKGANQAVAAARSGGDVKFIAKVGNDMFGKSAVNGLKVNGINIENVFIDSNAPSGVALIFVGADGENCIAVASGANANLAVEDITSVSETLSSADVLLTQLETPIETISRAVEISSNAGRTVILNPAPAQSLSDELISKLSVITPNETEAKILTGIDVKDEFSAEKAALLLQEKGVGTVIITMGAKGAFVKTPDDKFIVPGFRVEAVDTTAAGDVFNGCLAVAISNGKNIKDAVIFANAAAAISVAKMGAQPSIPDLAEINKFISEVS